jgi:hypothetical protein
LALIAGFYLEPEMEERMTLCDGLAVHVNAYIGVDGDRPDEAFAAKTGHNDGSTVVSLQPTFRNSWHLKLLMWTEYFLLQQIPFGRVGDDAPNRKLHTPVGFVHFAPLICRST